MSPQKFRKKTGFLALEAKETLVNTKILRRILIFTDKFPAIL